MNIIIIRLTPPTRVLKAFIAQNNLLESKTNKAAAFVFHSKFLKKKSLSNLRTHLSDPSPKTPPPLHHPLVPYTTATSAVFSHFGRAGEFVSDAMGTFARIHQGQKDIRTQIAEDMTNKRTLDVTGKKMTKKQKAAAENDYEVGRC